MQRSRDFTIRIDLLRLGCFVGAVVLAAMIFIGTPALTLPTLGSIVLVTLLSPWIAALERRGLSRNLSILIVLSLIVAAFSLAGWIAMKSWETQWSDLQENAPAYLQQCVERVANLEAKVRKIHPVLKDIQFAEKLSSSGNRWEAWAAEKGSAVLSEFMGCLFLIPILTFCLLSEGRKIRRSFFQLVPNRFFESVYIVSHGVFSAMSDYLRAKMIEAFLVGAMTTIGLAAIHSPYALVLGACAGITNIIPYLGPVLGAAPGLLLVLMGPAGHPPLWQFVTVYAVANLVDMLVIFPGIVAKLVNLNPLILIPSVVIGQYYYGILGMLVSIPIAAAIKVVLYEFYVIIYGFTPYSE